MCAVPVDIGVPAQLPRGILHVLLGKFVAAALVKWIRRYGKKIKMMKKMARWKRTNRKAASMREMHAPSSATARDQSARTRAEEVARAEAAGRKNGCEWNERRT